MYKKITLREKNKKKLMTIMSEIFARTSRKFEKVLIPPYPESKRGYLDATVVYTQSGTPAKSVLVVHCCQYNLTLTRIVSGGGARTFKFENQAQYGDRYDPCELIKDIDEHIKKHTNKEGNVGCVIDLTEDLK